MDKIRFACPICGVALKTGAEQAGQRGACPSCHEMVQIPARQSVNVSSSQSTPAGNASRLAETPVTQPPAIAIAVAGQLRQDSVESPAGTPLTNECEYLRRQEMSLAAFAEWSRWLIGVDVLGSAGCITVLKLGMDASQKGRVVTAVMSFLGSLALAAVLGLLSAAHTAFPYAYMKCRTWCYILGIVLAVAQFLLLAAGAWYLIDWVRHL
jgi:hypothetical protein